MVGPRWWCRKENTCTTCLTRNGVHIYVDPTSSSTIYRAYYLIKTKKNVMIKPLHEHQIEKHKWTKYLHNLKNTMHMFSNVEVQHKVKQIILSIQFSNTHNGVRNKNSNWQIKLTILTRCEILKLKFQYCRVPYLRCVSNLEARNT